MHPLSQRDESKLLVYKNEQITEDIYSNIATHLPANSLLVFNDTKVINARLRFQKSSGGIIEIFCLEPYDKINEYSSVMNKTGSVRWTKDLVGNIRASVPILWLFDWIFEPERRRNSVLGIF